MRRAQRGDADGFEHIYQSNCRRVYALCLRMVGNPAEAEDLTQEAFLTVLRKIRTFRGESAFSTWLHRIVVNLVLMRVRRKTLPKISREIPDESDRGAPSEELGGPDLHLAGPSIIYIWNAPSSNWPPATKSLSSSTTFKATSTKKSHKSWIGLSATRKPTCTAHVGGSVNCC